jgi:hypothetical protein
MNAAQANPMSATPSWVFKLGMSYSSTVTPHDRSSATSARTSLTSHDAWVCVSAVPVVLFVTASWVPPPGGRGRLEGTAAKMTQPGLRLSDHHRLSRAALTPITDITSLDVFVPTWTLGSTRRPATEDAFVIMGETAP